MKCEVHFFLKGGFTSRKAEKPPQGRKLQEKQKRQRRKVSKGAD